jgi:hypothetical protein
LQASAPRDSADAPAVAGAVGAARPPPRGSNQRPPDLRKAVEKVVNRFPICFYSCNSWVAAIAPAASGSGRRCP